MRNKVSVTFCIIGGILMIIASIVGSAAVYAIIFGYIKERLGGDTGYYMGIVLQICIYIALGGGVSVIIGSLITFKSLSPGKQIIGLGAGLGLIGFIVFIVTGIIAGTLTGTVSEIIIGLLLGPASYGIIGVFMTIFARRAMTKGKEKDNK